MPSFIRNPGDPGVQLPLSVLFRPDLHYPDLREVLTENYPDLEFTLAMIGGKVAELSVPSYTQEQFDALIAEIEVDFAGVFG